MEEAASGDEDNGSESILDEKAALMDDVAMTEIAPGTSADEKRGMQGPVVRNNGIYIS